MYIYIIYIEKERQRITNLGKREFIVIDTIFYDIEFIILAKIQQDDANKEPGWFLQSQRKQCLY